MNDKKFIHLFGAIKRGEEWAFAALGREVYALQESAEILTLARFMAAWHGYDDTHAILDNWIEELENPEEEEEELTEREEVLRELWGWVNSNFGDEVEKTLFDDVMDSVPIENLIIARSAVNSIDLGEDQSLFIEEKWREWLDAYEDAVEEGRAYEDNGYFWGDSNDD